jgi:ATP-dependent Zn protease
MNNLIRLKDLQVFYNSLNLELFKLNHIRKTYNPNRFLGNIEKSYHKKNILEFTSQCSCYLIYSFIYYFFPFWLIVLFFQIVRNQKVLILSLKKITFFISEYRTQTKILLLTTSKNTITFQVTIRLLPFVLGFCHMIWSRYKDQSFSFFVQTNLPGISAPYQKLSWETFKYIKSSEFTLNISPDSWDFAVPFNQIKSVANNTAKLKPNSNKTLKSSRQKDLFFPDKIENSQNERIDFYNDCILINAELMKNTHNIDPNFGVFKGVAKASPVGNKNTKLKWYQISDHDFISFFPLLEKSQLNFADTGVSAQNWLKSILKTENSDNLIVSSAFTTPSPDQAKSGNKNQIKSQKFYDLQEKQTNKSKIYLINSLLLSWKTFYYNLDELPKKLNTNFPTLKEKSIYVSQTQVGTKKPERKIVEGNQTPFENTYSLNVTHELKWPAHLNSEHQSQPRENLNFFVSKSKIEKYRQQAQITLNNPNNSKFLAFKKFTRLPLSIALGSLENTANLKNQVEIISNQLKFLNNFYKKSQLLNNELRNLFYNQGLKPLNLTKKTSKKQDFKINSIDTKYFQKNINDSIQFLTLIDATSDSEKNLLIQPRLMSGYQFPDMRVPEVEFLNIQFLYRNSFKLLFKCFFNFENSKNSIFSSLNSNPLKIELPPNCSSSVRYNFPNLKIPFLKWQYHPLLFKGSEIYPFYQAIEKDKVINNSQVQNWSNQYFSPDNPLTDRQQNFFGINENQKIFLQKNGQDFSSNLSILENKTDLIDEISKNCSPEFLSKYVFLGDLPVFTSSDKLKVPSLNKHESEFVVQQIKNQLKVSPNEHSKDKSENIEMPIDLMILRQPLQKTIIWPLTAIDYQQVNYFNVPNQYFGNQKFSSSGNQGLGENQGRLASSLDNSIKQASNISPKIIFHYIPYSQILLNQGLPETNNVSGIYQKIFSNSVFHESWEPPTSKSWLIVTQIIFGLAVLKILEKFYDYYGKEAISFCLEAIGMADESLFMDLGLDESEKGFRIIKSIQKRFQDVAGIDNILPELGEIVWFLRSSGKFFKAAKMAPKGILLIGPPGTGKTLLVQAIAGEAEVPILVQSGSTLDQDNLGAERLINLFKQARQLAPCIIFIDEIDTFGEQRKNVIPVESAALQSTEYEENESSFLPKPELDNVLTHNQVESQKQKNLSLLTQFLIEMDGLKSSNGVIVFGATNRPNILDPALTRPGRFEQILPLELPGKQKRIEILKFYSQNLGINLSASTTFHSQRECESDDQTAFPTISATSNLSASSLSDSKAISDATVNIQPVNVDSSKLEKKWKQLTEINIPQTGELKTESENLKGKTNPLALKDPNSKHTDVYSGFDINIAWNYLANRTIGFSAADLAAVMNESSMRAILDDTTHSIKTIEHGIRRITTYNLPAPTNQLKNYKDPFFVSRLAYYQAGKAVLYTLLKKHAPAVVLELWPQPKNIRYISEKDFLKMNLRSEFETRLIGLYAGKAAELLVLAENSYWYSDFGLDELSYASSLAQSMIDKWFFYSKTIAMRKFNQIAVNQNVQEIPENEIYKYLNQLARENEQEISQDLESSLEQQQNWLVRPWWQNQIAKQTEFLDRYYRNWYRIYLPDPEQSELNEEWVPPDKYFHKTDSLKNLSNPSTSSGTPSSDWLSQAQTLTSDSPSQAQTQKSLEEHNMVSPVDKVKTEFLQEQKQFQNLAKPVDQEKKNRTQNKIGLMALKLTNPSINWNDLYKIDRDYVYHGLVLNCFNKAFCILNDNREILDYFADYLMRNKILREYEVSEIFSDFGYSENLKTGESLKTESLKNEKKKTDQQKNQLNEKKTCFPDESLEKIILSKTWGQNSRRKNSRFITLENLQNNQAL